MESFLLLLDEIDDAAAVLRSLAPALLGFCLAACLLAAAVIAVIAVMLSPTLALGSLALLLGAVLLATVRGGVRSASR